MALPRTSSCSVFLRVFPVARDLAAQSRYSLLSCPANTLTALCLEGASSSNGHHQSISGLLGSKRYLPARGTKPLPRNLWDPYHLEELTKDGYSHKPLRVRRLGGRDPDTGRKVNQHIGGGTKFDYFVIDYQRRGPAAKGAFYLEKVLEVRRDPNRSAHIALVVGTKGKRWILATDNMTAGMIIKTTEYIPENPIVPMEGDSWPLGALIPGTSVCCVERLRDGGNTEDNYFIKQSGTCGQVVRHQGEYTVVALPHKHEFAMKNNCMAMVGKMSHGDLADKIFGSAQMHRRFGYKMSSGLWHKKTGYDGRKVRKLPAAVVLDAPEKKPMEKYKITLTKRQLSAKFGTDDPHPLIAYGYSGREYHHNE